MRDVEIGTPLFEPPIVVSDAACRSVGVCIGQVFRPGIESVYKQAAAVAPLDADRRAVIAIVTEIRVQLDRAELWIRLEVLVVPADVVESGVIRRHIQRKY